MKIVNSLAFVLMSCSPSVLMANSSALVSSATVTSGTENSALSIPDFKENTKKITTDVLFFYTSDAVEMAGGIDDLYDYVGRSIVEANDYMANSKVSLERRVSAVIPFPIEIDEVKGGLGSIGQYVADNKAELEAKYSSTYYVLIVGSMPDNNSGLAVLGKNVSMIMPYDGGGLENDTLAHELGHNDGLVHLVTGDENFETMGGFACGNESSLMTSTGANRTSNYLSSPEIINTETGGVCGHAVTADVRSFYYNAVENDRFNSSDFTFHNYLVPKEKNGTVSYSLTGDSFEENSEQISILIQWSGVTDFNSSVEFYAESLTANRDDFSFENSRVDVNSENGSVILTVTLIDDDVVENVESFTVGLRHNVGVNLSDTSSVISVISDDNPPKGHIQLSGDYIATEGGRSTIKLDRVGGAYGEITLSITTVNGTALASDYSISDTSITFADGEITKEIYVDAIDDLLDENNESFTIEVTANEFGVDVDGGVLFTIVDNDDPVESINPESSSSSGGGMGFAVFILIASVLTRGFISVKA